MRQQLQRLGVLVLGLFLSGCSQSTPIEEVPVEVVEESSLKETIDVSLADLLAKPREELAAQAEELTTRLQIQEKAYLEGQLPFALLPELRLSLAAPVLREAAYSSQVGFSLPAYAPAGKPDSPLALHLARFGDAEAARKLADPADAGMVAKIDACRYERNYPVEWTRLVGLMLHSAQVRLAIGDLDGATELAALHKHLRDVLDPRAAQGPLGSELLARGHQAFALAAAAWKRDKKAQLSKQAASILESWGSVPMPAVAIPFGSSRQEMASVLRSQPNGHFLPAASTNRALDLLALPLPGEGLELIFATFDDRDRLTEVQMAYRPRLIERFPGPARLGLRLEDYLVPTQEDAGTTWLRKRSYSLGALACDILMPSRGHAVGAFVRFHDPRSEPAPVALTRDFGAVNLDRSFEQNRLGLAPELLSDSIQSNNARALARISNPVALLEPACAVLQRDAPANVTARLALTYAVEHEALLSKVAVPLWSSAGAGRVEPREDAQGDYLAMVWEDPQTRYVLRLGNAVTPSVDFTVEDRRVGKDLPARAALAAAFDDKERQARFAADRLLRRIPRSVEIDTIQLGMPRDRVVEALAEREDIAQKEITNGLSVIFTADPDRKAAYTARQMFIRFDKSGHVAEIRVRYQDGPASTGVGAWSKELLATWQKKAGAGASAPAPWAAEWADLPARKPAPALHRWVDDATALTCQCDGAGAEVTLRACSREHTTGLPLGPLEFLPRGSDGYKLGMSRAEVLQKLGTAKPTTTPDGGIILPAAKKGRHDMVIVWLENDRAVRIAAHHRREEGVSTPDQLADKLQKLWRDEGLLLGWPRRQDVSVQKGLQGLAWQDDSTRIRHFWEKPAGSTPQVYTEWKDLTSR